jgi:hypothetical protein
LGAGDRVRVGDDIVRDKYGWSHPVHKGFAKTYDAPSDTLGPCGCTDYHMADCPTRTGYTAEDRFDDWEANQARAERDRDNAEYAAGVEDARRYRFERDTMGEAWAAQNEYERDMRGLNGDW